jgi:transcriptional regulator with XRE-family HTH domain
LETHSLRYSRMGAILRAMRETRGLTQMEFSRRLGKPFHFVSMYENGERRLDVLEFNSIARELQVDAAETLRKIDPMPRADRRPKKKRARSVDRSSTKKRGSKLKADVDTVWISCCVRACIDHR